MTYQQHSDLVPNIAHEESYDEDSLALEEWRDDQMTFYKSHTYNQGMDLRVTKRIQTITFSGATSFTNSIGKLANSLRIKPYSRYAAIGLVWIPLIDARSPPRVCISLDDIRTNPPTRISEAIFQAGEQTGMILGMNYFVKNDELKHIKLTIVIDGGNMVERTNGALLRATWAIETNGNPTLFETAEIPPVIFPRSLNLMKQNFRELIDSVLEQSKKRDDLSASHKRYIMGTFQSENAIASSSRLNVPEMAKNYEESLPSRDTPIRPSNMPKVVTFQPLVKTQTEIKYVDRSLPLFNSEGQPVIYTGPPMPKFEDFE